MSPERNTPIAWFYVDNSSGANDWHWMTEAPDSHECDPEDWTPVYLQPRPDPLTEDQIEEAYRTLYRRVPFGATAAVWIEAAIRYAEAKHGIGGES